MELVSLPPLALIRTGLVWRVPMPVLQAHDSLCAGLATLDSQAVQVLDFLSALFHLGALASPHFKAGIEMVFPQRKLS